MQEMLVGEVGTRRAIDLVRARREEFKKVEGIGRIVVGDFVDDFHDGCLMKGRQRRLMPAAELPPSQST